MTDVLTKEQRSFNMSRVRSKDSKPELIIRKLIHRNGFRFRLNEKNLPGSPDLVFKKHNAVVFVHGCFWHMHTCNNFKLPATRIDFWKKKLLSNVSRDIHNISQLHNLRWRTCIIWECKITGKSSLSSENLYDKISSWLYSEIQNLVI